MMASNEIFGRQNTLYHPSMTAQWGLTKRLNQRYQDLPLLSNLSLVPLFDVSDWVQPKSFGVIILPSKNFIRLEIYIQFYGKTGCET